MLWAAHLIRVYNCVVQEIAAYEPVIRLERVSPPLYDDIFEANVCLWPDAEMYLKRFIIRQLLRLRED